jgi:hypothetical protein
VMIDMDAKIKKKIVYPFHIKFDNKNRLWLYGTDNEKKIFFRCNKYENNGLKAEFIGELEFQKYSPALSNYTWNFEYLVSQNNTFWIIGNTGIYRFNDELKQFLPYSALNIKKDLTGFSPEDTKEALENQEFFTPVIRNNEAQSKIKPIHIETFLVDHQNTLWQGILGPGSMAMGLTLSIATSRGFKHYFLGKNPENGLNAIFPVLKDHSGNVWAGPTNVNQIFRMDNKGQTRQDVPIDRDIWKVAGRPRVFLEDSTGIWMGYFNNLLLRYDFKTQQFLKEIFKKTNLNDRSLPANFIHLKKEGDDIFIFGYKDIFKYNTKTSRITPLKLFDQPNKYNIYSVLRDGKNGWWVGTGLSRLYHYDNQFKEISHYTIGSMQFNVEDIIPGDNNDLWISQLGGGLARFDKTTGKSEIYTTANGLSNNTCYGLLKDKNGNIWVSTNHGISRFNPKTKQFRTFGPNEGLKIDEFNSDATYEAHDGEFFFGGMGGVVSFYSDSIKESVNQDYVAPLVITDFKVNGEPRFFEKAIYNMDMVELKKGDNNFQVSFACLDFRNSDKIKYRYHLSGENKEFLVTDHQHRSVNFSNLIPGEYRLEIEATNRDGDWVSKSALLIVIPPFYYQSVWFRILSVLSFVFMIGYLVYEYNHRIRLKARQQQEVLRLESLRGQMNPHFIFNSLNSINYFISQNDRLSANRYIADFSRLIRSILGNMSNDYIPLSKELESLKDYLRLEHLRFGDKFDYSFQVQNGITTDEIMVFPGMVQPFVENAIWHGVRGLENRKGFVKIEFLLDEKDSFCCIIEDDGIGRKLSEARKSAIPGKTSRGIGIVMERLRIVNNLRKANFQVKFDDVFPDREESGTRVIIDIPTKVSNE